jgi:hypothetical protein
MESDQNRTEMTGPNLSLILADIRWHSMRKVICAFDGEFEHKRRLDRRFDWCCLSSRASIKLVHGIDELNH